MRSRDLKIEIEAAVRAQQSNRVEILTDLHLRAEKHSLHSRLELCDWYRRMGWYRKGYLMMKPAVWPTRKVSSAAPEGAQVLWSARFLDLLGGTAFAIPILGRVRCLTASDHRAAGSIYRNAYEFPKALAEFSAAEEMELESTAYSARMGRLGKGDCLAALGRTSEAIESLRSLQDITDEKLFRGMLLQAEGEYLAIEGRWGRARTRLQSAMRYYPNDTLTPEHGILYKWVGYVEGKLGQKIAAQDAFQRALASLKIPTQRPEAWLDVLRLMNEVGMLPEKEKPLLAMYPGLPARFPSKEGALDAPFEIGRKQARLWISSPRGEGTLDGQPFLGIPRELQLADLLRRTEAHGLSMIRAASVLWPNEPQSLSHLDQRIHLLLHRLRKVYGLAPYSDRNTIYLSETCRKDIRIEYFDQRLALKFFEVRPFFRSSDFREYYGLKKSQAALRLHQAVKNGAVLKSSRTSGPRLEYQVSSSQ